MIDEIARRQQTREIELELIRVRSAAEAARLESRAAELELMLRRLMASGSDVDLPVTPLKSLPSESELFNRTEAPGPLRERALPDSWSSRISRMETRDLPSPVTIPTVSGSRPSDPSSTLREQIEQRLWQRIDASSTSRPAPHFLEHPEIVAPLEGKSEVLSDSFSDTLVVNLKLAPETEDAAIIQPTIAATPSSQQSKPPTSQTEESAKTAKTVETAVLTGPLFQKPKNPSIPLPAINPVDDDEELEPKRRFRPASFLVSTLAHVVVLIVLGAATLANKQPKDQLAFTSSVSESSEETMETFAIESNEPMDQTEPLPAESAYEISTVGKIAVTEVSMDLPPAPAPPTTADLLSSSSSSLSSSAMKSLKSDTGMKSQFCGVDGGGSHFVYLVDSSGSMRDGFQSARTELLASIDQLKPDQRFYVVFFDEAPDFMRISDPNTDESASVMATPENKQRLRKWAMTVDMNKGKAPYDILPFALKLRPDVIFLLSDGEFPVKIEEILREQNRQENLFGESGPISIVHTIRYHGIEGETGRKAEETMVKIAKENGGQYRHVPKPK